MIFLCLSQVWRLNSITLKTKDTSKSGEYPISQHFYGYSSSAFISEILSTAEVVFTPSSYSHLLWEVWATKYEHLY